MHRYQGTALRKGLRAPVRGSMRSWRQDGGAPPMELGFFGSKGITGGGNWGLAQDRAMSNGHALAHDGLLQTGYLYIIPASGSGSTPVKMCVYSDLAGVPDQRLAISDAVVVSGGGVIAFPFHGESIPLGQRHIIAVSGAVGGAGWDMGSYDSGGAQAARIHNGTFSYANPPTTCPAADAQYANGLAAYIEYLYTP